MKSEGPPPPARIRHDGRTDGNVIREFAMEIIEADGEWVETNLILVSRESGRIHRQIGKSLAEVSHNGTTMYGRMRDSE